MRIALYHHLPPGGALRSVTEILRALPPAVVCDIYTPDSSAIWPFSIAGQSTDLGGRSVVREPVDTGVTGRIAGGRLARLGLIGGVHEAERRLATKIDAGGYDAVLVHPCWVTQTPKILTMLKTPTVYYMHEPRRASFERDYAPRPFPRTLKLVPRWTVGQVIEARLKQGDIRAATAPNLVLSNSYYSAESIQKAYGVTPSVSYLGVDADLFKIDSVVQRENAVVSVGGFEKFKGHHLLAEAIGRLPIDRRPTLRLVYERFDPVYREEVRARCVALGVVLEEHHAVGDQDLVRLYQSSRALVLAASLEPFGLTMLEAMACGTPVVALREGGYREVVAEGRTGYLVDREGERDLTWGIAKACVAPNSFSAEDVRSSIVPFWTWQAAAERQVFHLRRVMCEDVPI